MTTCIRKRKLLNLEAKDLVDSGDKKQIDQTRR